MTGGRTAVLTDLPLDRLRGTRVLVRVDFNVPFAENGSISDDTRIRAVLPTLRELREAGCALILFSHRGRPKGVPDEAYTLRPVATALSEMLGIDIGFCEATRGDELRTAAEGLGAEEVLLVENTRFEPGEESDEGALGEEWAALGAHFVNDAFGTAHRAHASTSALPEATRRSGGMAVAGRLMERELRFLGEAMADPARPFVAVIGGAKISGKIDVIEALLPRVDRLLIGGAMANTFFLALGLDVGESLVEEDRVEVAHELMERAGAKLVLPVDCRVAGELSETTDVRIVERTEVGREDRIFDLGSMSSALFGDIVLQARTVLWNGPMGVFEVPPFDSGTTAVAEAVAVATDRGAISILGGGDSAAAAAHAGVADRLTHVSTGGGASLEFLAGSTLPGVRALTRIDSEGDVR